MELLPQFPPRPEMPPLDPPSTEYDPILQDWFDLHVTYWRSEECVVLPKVAVNAMRSVAHWRRGVNAVDTILPPGTPVATFMGRRGQPSDLWDGGEGLGITGNNTTHAGVLAGYVLDGNGTVAALKLWELYPGCGMRTRRRIYPVDDTAFGTANARNYHAILEPSLLPLGGRDNPYFRLWLRSRDVEQKLQTSQRA